MGAGRKSPLAGENAAAEATNAAHTAARRGNVERISSTSPRGGRLPRKGKKNFETQRKFKEHLSKKERSRQKRKIGIEDI
jgi:hypothetical protein